MLLASAAVGWNAPCTSPFCQLFCALQSAAQTVHVPVPYRTHFALFSSLSLVQRNCVCLRLPQQKWHLSDLLSSPSANQQQQARHCLSPPLNIPDQHHLSHSKDWAIAVIYPLASELSGHGSHLETDTLAKLLLAQQISSLTWWSCLRRIVLPLMRKRLSPSTSNSWSFMKYWLPPQLLAKCCAFGLWICVFCIDSASFWLPILLSPLFYYHCDWCDLLK